MISFLVIIFIIVFLVVLVLMMNIKILVKENIMDFHDTLEIYVYIFNNLQIFCKSLSILSYIKQIFDLTLYSEENIQLHKHILTQIKDIKIKFKEYSNIFKYILNNISLKSIDLSINYGLINPCHNIVLVAFSYSTLGIIFSYLINKYEFIFNKKIAITSYQNKSSFELYSECIISIKLVHIIFIIHKYLINKRAGD